MNKSFLVKLTRPPWRTLAICLLVMCIFLLGYQVWSPGETITDGRHDRKQNGIWLQHGWIGDDTWFDRYSRDRHRFRSQNAILELKHRLSEHHISDVFPHLAPCSRNGKIAHVDPDQTHRFIENMDGFRILPWVGGVLHVQAFPESKAWRREFIQSIYNLLTAYPKLAGIHINIEPLPSGNLDFLKLLQTLKQTLPREKLLSIAAYPPPTIFQQTDRVHWGEAYFRQVSQIADQMAVMMYDTGLRYRKPYRNLMRAWTREVLQWSGDTDVLLGVPAYDDAGVNYHHPHVENIKNSLMGIHAGLKSFPKIPAHYQGIAIYSEWELTDDEWDVLRDLFLQD